MRCIKTLTILGLIVSLLLLTFSFPVVLGIEDNKGLTLLRSVEWGSGRGDKVTCISVADVDNDSVNEIITVGMIWKYTPQNPYTEYTMFGQLRIWTWDETVFKLEGEKEWEDTYAWAVLVADVDKDSVKEVIASTQSRGGDKGGLYIWQWNGSILFEKASEVWNENSRVYSISAGNIDDDPAIEVITVGDCSGHGQLHVWNLNESHLDLKASVEWGIYMKPVLLSDIDYDSDLEIITGGFCLETRETSPTIYHTNPQSKLMIWELDNGTLSQREITSVTAAQSVFVADVDNDFTKEILTGGATRDLGGSRLYGHLSVWSFSGMNLTFEAGQDWHTIGLTSVSSVVAADIDRDRETEIITAGKASDEEPYWVGDSLFAGRDQGQIRVWVKDRVPLELRGSFEWRLGDFTRAETVCASDVNRDGTMEVITGGTCGWGAQLAIWSKASTPILVIFLASITVAGIIALILIIFWHSRALRRWTHFRQ